MVPFRSQQKAHFTGLLQTSQTGTVRLKQRHTNECLQFERARSVASCGFVPSVLTICRKERGTALDASRILSCRAPGMDDAHLLCSIQESAGCESFSMGTSIGECMANRIFELH